MKIVDLFARPGISVSFEVFPPKKESGFPQMQQVVREIAALSPSFLSVTFGAGGGTAQNTARIAELVQECGVPALAHLTCASMTREQIGAALADFRARGVENVLALRGDLPPGSEFPTPQQYRYAGELVREIRARGDFCIGAACYPEGHVECEHKEDDIGHLKEKVDGGCDFLTTQMFFDNNIFYNFLYRILAKDIRVPVAAGIMPVTNANQIRRICALSGTALPPRFLAIVDRFSASPEAMKQAGIAYATEQIIDLIANGVRAVHVYTMNRPDVARRIMENLSEILKT